MKKDIFVFNHFKEFASFCLLRKFDDLCEEYLLRLKELNESSLEILSHLTEGEICEFLRERLEAFLKAAINDSALREVEIIIANWKQGKLPSAVNKYAIRPADILFGFVARKNALLTYLPEFTDNFQHGLLITAELNIFNLLLEERICEAFIEIQQEMIAKSNEELNRTNRELQYQILEKIEIEKKLRREKEFSDAVINNSIDGIFAFDTDLRITAWNRTLEKLNGLSEKEVVGKNIFDLFPSYRNGQEGEAFLRVLHGEKANLGDKAYYNSNEKGFYEAFMVPLFNDKEEIAGGLSIIRDVTPRKLAEDKLKQRENMLKEAQEIAHLGSWEWIVRNNKMIWSDEIYRILGYAPGDRELTLSSFYAHLYDERAEMIREIIEHAYRNLGSFSIDVKVKRKDGEVRYLMVKGKVMAYHNNIPYKMMGVVWDITDRKIFEEALRKKNQELAEKNNLLEGIQEELRQANNELEQRVWERTRQLSEINLELNNEIAERKKMEEALKQRNEELLKINDDLDNFVYTASHDLKAPISNIEGLVASLMLELKDLDGEAKVIIDLINQCIIKFKETINDLTEITKAQKNIQEDITLIDLNVLIEEIKLSIKDLIRNSRAQIQCDGECFPKIRFSKANLKSIFYNLLSNAIKYRHPERMPEIRINCTMMEDYVMIAVRDNGLGINKEQQNKVFTMFKRLHDHVEGSGIGLYLVKRIVDNNGGWIELDSEEGQGSEFRIFLKAV